MVILGVIVSIAFGLLLMVNGAYLMASPRAWFNLPEWIAPRNSNITPEKYASGLGAIEMRLMGAVFFGLPIWVVYDMFFSR